ncbi:MAG: M1 family aminopeptidase [Bacteroidia bacterium]|nr:M1 family aminopeptidase [Bacteroidia bacterium]
MFRTIFLFELAYRLPRPATWIYPLIIFLLVFGATCSDAIVIGGAVGNVHRNATTVITNYYAILSAFGMLITSALISTSVYRDFEHNVHQLYFTTPITKWSYLVGRFTGSLLITALVFLSLPLGSIVGSWIAPLAGWIEAEKFGPIILEAYLRPYLLIVLPNIFFSGAIFFSLATLTRNLLYTYVGNVVLLVVYLWSLIALGNLESKTLAAILDPFALATITKIFEYWTPAEANNLLLPLDPILLLNRGLWLAIGFLLLGFTYYRFDFSAFLQPLSKKKKVEGEEALVTEKITRELPSVLPIFTWQAQLRNLLRLTILEFKNIIKEIPFIAISLCGLLLVILNSSQAGKLYGTEVWPVTYKVLDLLKGNFILFFLIIIVFYSGELVWRERTLRLHQITDALPIPTTLFLKSKFLSLMAALGVLLVGLLLVGIGIQVSHGYTRFELGLYFIELFVLVWFQLLLYAALAFAIHVLVNQKFVGHFVMVLFFIATSVLPQLGVEHNLFLYPRTPGYQYSDMNQYGHFLHGVWAYYGYWGFLALLLLLLSLAFWIRGTISSAKERLQIALLRMKNKYWMVAASICLLGFGIMGGYIYYNTCVLNTFFTQDEELEKRVEYEKKYKKYQKLPQPRIVAFQGNIDIYPYERKVLAKGALTLKNTTATSIQEVHFTLNPKQNIKSLVFSLPAKIKSDDKELGYRIYTLSQPLAPQDSCLLNFEIALEYPGFTDSYQLTTKIVENGTFFNNFDFLPAIGYDSDAEISDKDKRKKYGLPPKPRMKPLQDKEARKNTYLCSYADWINFEATVSTSADQIAIAPGYLVKEWQEGDRKYFHYKMDRPILYFFSIVSAKYAIRRDKWKDVNIEIYYHPGHEYNLDKMIKSIKNSLEYYTHYFSPYQHKQVRILEFPRYATFAQSFPNTIPYSEGLGFIARLRDPNDIDYVYFVTAHEVAHQWWAHQVIGANVQGATLLSETMAEYSALMVMQREYGKEHMHRFLQYELDDYLQGRTVEREKELPLKFVEDQQYIHYNKGSLIMYALQDYIGEDSLNAALRRFIQKVAYQRAPFTTSEEFIENLREATPDSLKYLITDMFEKITLYANRAIKATATPLEGGKYKVKLELEVQKFYADSVGNEKMVPLHDWIDVGIFAENINDKSVKIRPLYLRKHLFTQSKNTFEIVVDKKPLMVGIDPLNKLIDRIPEDNVVKVEF